jgi:hypothetical protein
MRIANLNLKILRFCCAVFSNKNSNGNFSGLVSSEFEPCQTLRLFDAFKFLETRMRLILMETASPCRFVITNNNKHNTTNYLNTILK